MLAADPELSEAAFAVDPATAQGSVLVLESATPADEFSAVAAQVREVLDAGTPAGKIVIAVPNKSWARNIAKALNDAEIPSATLPSSQPIHGDIRDNTKCIPARVMTALKLVADPQDNCAWRSWCGFGDYLVYSSAMTSLRTYGEEHGTTLVETLDCAAAAFEAGTDQELFGGHVIGLKGVIEAYQAGLALIENAQGLEGRALLEALTKAVAGEDVNAAHTIPGAVVTLCEPDVAPATAADMVARAEKNAFAPTLKNANAVALIPYNQMAGLCPDTVIISGFVNGFIPISEYFDGAEMTLEKQLQTHTKDTKTVYTMVNKADKTLAGSCFTSTDVESGAMLKLKIDRIRLRNGKSVCSISPSIFLEEITK